MTWLIVFVASITVQSQNGMVTQAPPQPQFIPFTNIDTCNAAKAAIDLQFPAGAQGAQDVWGNYRAFTICKQQ